MMNVQKMIVAFAIVGLVLVQASYFRDSESLLSWTTASLSTGVQRKSYGNNIPSKNNQLFFIGGLDVNNNPLDSFSIFDSISNSFTNGPALPEARFGGCSCVGGRNSDDIITFGIGKESSFPLVYSFSSAKWMLFKHPDSPQQTSTVSSCVTDIDGKVHYFSEQNEYIFNLDDGSVEQRSTPFTASGSAILESHGDLIYFSDQSAWRQSFGESQWYEVTRCPAELVNPASAFHVDSNKIFVVGQGFLSDQVHVYDISSDSWETETSLADTLDTPSMAIMNGQILVTDISHQLVANLENYVASAQLYDRMESSTSTSTTGDFCNYDGIVNNAEECDDGNHRMGDGCSRCSVDPGWTCVGNPSVCSNCGNGKIESGEYCDDKNKHNGDGCSSVCAVETNYVCNGQPSICQSCGNGRVEGTEGCDDGNNNNGDGCDSTCAVEPKYYCGGSPSHCVYAPFNITSPNFDFATETLFLQESTVALHFIDPVSLASGYYANATCELVVENPNFFEEQPYFNFTTGRIGYKINKKFQGTTVLHIKFDLFGKVRSDPETFDFDLTIKTCATVVDNSLGDEQKKICIHYPGEPLYRPAFVAKRDQREFQPGVAFSGSMLDCDCSLVDQAKFVMTTNFGA